MAWTATFNIHPDNQAIGDATGTWNAGLPDQFIFSETITNDTPGYTQFANDAKAAKTKNDTNTTKDSSAQTQITTLLNS